MAAVLCVRLRQFYTVDERKNLQMALQMAFQIVQTSLVNSESHDAIQKAN